MHGVYTVLYSVYIRVWLTLMCAFLWHPSDEVGSRGCGVESAEAYGWLRGLTIGDNSCIGLTNPTCVGLAKTIYIGVWVGKCRSLRLAQGA